MVRYCTAVSASAHHLIARNRDRVQVARDFDETGCNPTGLSGWSRHLQPIIIGGAPDDTETLIIVDAPVLVAVYVRIGVQIDRLSCRANNPDRIGAAAGIGRDVQRICARR